MDKQLMRALRGLDEYELRRLIIYAQGLLIGSDGPSFTPPPDTYATNVRYRQQYVRCGKASCTRCPHGPYWYAYWRENGRARSRYVGKQLPESAVGD
jgi:hypothetical protein